MISQYENNRQQKIRELLFLSQRENQFISFKIGNNFIENRIYFENEAQSIRFESEQYKKYFVNMKYFFKFLKESKIREVSIL
jgi:hypothetical protein